MRALACLALLLSVGCDEGTYVGLTIAPGSSMPSGVTHIELGLTLDGKSASASYGDGKKTLSLPTTATLKIEHGRGHLVIVANAFTDATSIVATGTTSVEVVDGKTVKATVSFGDDTSTDGGGNADGGDVGDMPSCGCDVNATCNMSSGSAVCTCKAGYHGDGTSCVDDNECTTDMGLCDAHATCSNTPGSYMCACNAGYVGDGKMCHPVWTLVKSVDMLSFDAFGHAIGTPDGKIYIGDESSGGAYFQVIDTLANPVSATALPVPMNEWCNCGYSGRTHLVADTMNGGSRFWLWGSNLQDFDIASSTWVDHTAVWPTTAPPIGSTGALLGSRMYVLGGGDAAGNRGPTLAMHAFDIDTTGTPTLVTDTTFTPPPNPLLGGASWSYNNKIYVIWGQILVGSSPQSNPKMLVFDPSVSTGSTTGEWTRLGTVPFSSPQDSSTQYTAIQNNKAHVIDQQDKMQAYDLGTDTWDTPVSMPPISGQHGSWIPAVAGTPEKLYALNYSLDAGAGTTAVLLYQYTP